MKRDIEVCPKCEIDSYLTMENREFNHFIVCRQCGLTTKNHLSMSSAIKQWNDYYMSVKSKNQGLLKI